MATSPLGTNVPSITELQANAARLLQESLSAAQQTGIPFVPKSVTELDLARSNIRALSFVLGMSLHGVYRFLRDFIARQAIPIKSTGEFLDGWLATYGLARKELAAATGVALGTGTPGASVAVGTLMQTSDGRQYRVTTAAIVPPAINFSVTVAAVVAGQASNLAPGTTLVLVSPIAGIDATFLSSTPASVGGGADPETDAQAIYRLQQRLANVPLGGSPADYARWALTVPGITRAWGLRNPAGPTTAGVMIMADGNAAPGLPSVAQESAVRVYIADPLRGPPDELFVLVPTPVAINFTIALSPDSPTLRASVELALKDLFYRESVPGQPIPQSHLKEVISSAVGEYNHAIIAPIIFEGSFLEVDSRFKLLVLGTVAFV
jgi:uncharacterized phage protein gp47/JayE